MQRPFGGRTFRRRQTGHSAITAISRGSDQHVPRGVKAGEKVGDSEKKGYNKVEFNGDLDQPLIRAMGRGIM